MDKITIQQRSRNMSKIRATSTKPEILVRKILWSLGYRYRLNDKRFLGKPDIYIPRIRTVVFVNGCFWHQHEGCSRNFMPKSRVEYWKPKLKRNVLRLKEQMEKIRESGYKVVSIWECETKSKDQLQRLIVKRLSC